MREGAWRKHVESVSEQYRQRDRGKERQRVEERESDGETERHKDKHINDVFNSVCVQFETSLHRIAPSGVVRKG